MPNCSNTRSPATYVWLLLIIFCYCAPAAAQSTDIAWPTPVRTNEVSGSISARDIGDPRVTDHFYAFTGMPGDVLVTVDSNNLNGDIDVFTLSGLRPLLKFTVYAGSSASNTRSIFLRTQENLILRVEGRTPNDDPATYRIGFGGAFAPITSGPLAEHEAEATPASEVATAATGGRRVSSSGARIDEPRTEVVAAPTPEPAPAEAATREPSRTASRTNSRNRNPRRPATRRTPAAAPATTSESPAETTKSGTGDQPGDAATGPPETRPPARRGSRRNPTARKPVAAPVQPATEAAGPRLVIETSDGTLVDRDMNSVRRVTVENGQVVVLGKDGKIQRIPLTTVVRMTIAP
ncbi:MAG: hypothetical protein QOD33_1152 [Pyrinomonadaceae bacterium]|nr:hypothetical protein [Pyrinomonadaceae bacterium]